MSNRVTCLLDLGGGTQRVRLYTVSKNLCEVASADGGLATALSELACREANALPINRKSSWLGPATASRVEQEPGRLRGLDHGRG